MTTPTIDELEYHAHLLSASFRSILLGLAKVNYEGQMKVSKEFLIQRSIVLLSETDVKRALEALLALNKLAGETQQNCKQL